MCTGKGCHAEFMTQLLHLMILNDKYQLPGTYWKQGRNSIRKNIRTLHRIVVSSTGSILVGESANNLIHISHFTICFDTKQTSST